MTNKLNLEKIDLLYESTRKYQEATLSGGETIRYYNKFSDTKIEKVLKELYEALAYDEENNLRLFKEDETLFQYSYFLVIKHFTDFGKEFPNDFESSIVLFNKMIELELFTEIINNVLPLNEVGRVIERIKTRHKAVNYLVEQQDLLDDRMKELNLDMNIIQGWNVKQ